MAKSHRVYARAFVTKFKGEVRRLTRGGKVGKEAEGAVRKENKRGAQTRLGKNGESRGAPVGSSPDELKGNH